MPAVARWPKFNRVVAALATKEVVIAAVASVAIVFHLMLRSPIPLLVALNNAG